MLQRRKSGWELTNTTSHSVTEGTPVRPPKSYVVKGTTWANSQIICTIGPGTNNVESLSELILEGMSVARLNFSHGDFKYHGSVIENVRAAAKATGRYVAIMLDTKGPEIRSGKLKDGKPVDLETGNTFTFTNDQSVVGDNTIVSTTYDSLSKTLSVGDQILVDDGLISFEVTAIEDGNVVTKVMNSGTLGQTKGVNLPGSIVDLPSVTEKDKADIAFGVSQGVDFIAASFIRRAENIEEIRNLPGVRDANIHIIAKIESQEGLDNYREILQVVDGIMVARGDLGVEIPIQKVANAQKMMIRHCNLKGKPVITATQMLDSMMRNPRPTRAEACDVANAVYDGSDCVMLSGETANGSYPSESVRMMNQICVEAESQVDYAQIYRDVRNFVVNQRIAPITETIASSAVKSAWDLDAALIIVLTDSGSSARYVSKYRPHCPILAVTSTGQTSRQLKLARGVIPHLVDSMSNADEVLESSLAFAKEHELVLPGEYVVITSGQISGRSGSTNLLKVHVMDE
eukprot:TRINITY_DN3023_c0_g2_i1.p1 TRINITY_DN3023_c0_g2~~TRINITY_DN3023_c0_g2_i1.p1  ORF type:complete len:541 (-),score=157.75 TRINITY_DN3023_c0_g2_i1:178-1725(-)